jgi:hypothetical protein
MARRGAHAKRVKVTTTAMVNPGDFRSRRKVSPRCCSNPCIGDPSASSSSIFFLAKLPRFFLPGRSSNSVRYLRASAAAFAARTI